MGYRNEVREETREGMWTFWHLLPRGLLVLVVLGTLGYGLTLLFRPAQLATRVTDPDRIISNYEWFEEAYNDCLALDSKISSTRQQIVSQFEGLPKDRTQWSRQDRDAWNQWQVTLNGQRSQRQNIVGEYNAKSKMITRQLWKSPTLPYQLAIVDDQTVGAE